MKILLHHNSKELENCQVFRKFSEKFAATLYTESNLVEDCKKLKCIDYSNNDNNSFQEFFKENIRTRLFRKSAPL